MPKTVKPLQKYKSTTAILVSIFLILLGVLLFRVFAAGEEEKVLSKFGDLKFSYLHEVPLTASKATDNSIIFDKASQSVEVARDGTMYCMPLNASTGKIQKIASENTADLYKKIAQYSEDKNEVEQSLTNSFVNDYVAISVVNESTKDSKTVRFKSDNKTQKFSKLESQLLSLCNDSGIEIKRNKKPRFDPPAKDFPAESPLSVITVQGVINQFIPRAQALAQNPAYAVSQLQLLNNTRAQNGLPYLVGLNCLNTIADNWSKYMAQNNILIHNPFFMNNSTCSGLWSNLGENVGSSGGTSETLFQSFMNSPLHKANILNTAYEYVAISAWTSDNGTNYVTQDFMRCQRNLNNTSSCNSKKGL